MYSFHQVPPDLAVAHSRLTEAALALTQAYRDLAGRLTQFKTPAVTPAMRRADAEFMVAMNAWQEQVKASAAELGVEVPYKLVPARRTL